MIQLIFFAIGLAVLGTIFFAAFQKKVPVAQQTTNGTVEILGKHVLFYQKLATEDKERFEKQVDEFLERVRITGVKTTIADMDRVFVAAAAIIPVFAFGHWQYRNIHEVLLYPESFGQAFQQEGNERNVLGMVGDGAMRHVMILSQHDLRNGFLNHTDTSNTAIHEFVHLVDGADGDIDGVPGALIPHRYSVPWLQRIHQEIAQIQADKSDINPYGATNEAEFLAVAAEYFFEQPAKMERKHPELYVLLKSAFMPGE